MTDATLTFSEYLQEEIRNRGLEFNEENVQNLLQDKEVISGLRTAAAARGIAIGVIDALTLKLGTSLTKPLSQTLGKPGAALAGTGIEAVGGGVGEAAGQTTEIVTGQRESLDTTEIALESIAEIAGPGTAVQVSKVVGTQTGIIPTGDAKPSADLSNIPQYRPSAEVVNEVEATGVVNADVKPETAAIEINRVTVEAVNAGLEAEGVTIETASPEQIEAVIPRIQQEVVSTLQSEGIIQQDVDIQAPEITALIKRVAVESVNAGVEATGVETEAQEPSATSQPIPKYTPTVETVSEIEKAGIISEDVKPEKAAAEIQRIAVKAVNAGLEAQGLTIETASPEEVQATIGQYTPTVEEVSELEAAGIIPTDTPPSAIKPLIERIAVESVGQLQAAGVVDTSVKPTAEDTVAQQYTPTVETVNEVKASGIIASNQTVEAAVPQIQRIAVKSVIDGLVAAGIQPAEIDIETIKAEIPRIDVEVVNELKQAGVIPLNVKPSTAIPIIQRIAVDTVNEIQRKAEIQSEVNIAARDVTAEIQAPRAIQSTVNELTKVWSSKSTTSTIRSR